MWFFYNNYKDFDNYIDDQENNENYTGLDAFVSYYSCKCLWLLFGKFLKIN